MSNNPNPEIAQLDPGNIAMNRFRAVNGAVDLLASARDQISAGTRIPKHSLVDFSEVPDDIWQKQAQKQLLALKPAVFAAEQPQATTDEVPVTAQGPFPVEEQGSDIADELLRQAQAAKDAIYDASEKEETAV